MPLDIQEWNDQPSWDDFVGSQRNGHFNQGWGWGELAVPLGGHVHRLAVTQDGNIVAAASVVRNSIKYVGRSQLYISHGPAVDHITDETLLTLDKGLRDLAHDHKAIGVKMEPYVPAGDRAWLDALRHNGFTTLYPGSQGRSMWILNLEPSLDELLAAMKPKWRYNIRLASKKGVEIVTGGPSDLDVYYNLYLETAERDKFFIHEKWVYEKTFQILWNLGQFELLFAYFEGEPIAAVTLVHLGQTAWYMYGASTSRHREVMAPQALQWAAIQWSKGRGATYYDFRGVPDVPARGQEMLGVYRFKQGFGGDHQTVLEQYGKAYQPLLYRSWQCFWQARYFAQEVQRYRSGEPHRPFA